MLSNKPAPTGTNLHRSNVSRYIQLATLFKRRIQSGVWAAGSQIPTIDELVEETGVARATVRQALGVLESEGLLARFRGKGTFVLEKEDEGFWCEVEADWQELLTGRPGASIEVIANTLSGPPADAPTEMGKVADQYRLLRRHHSRDGRVFLVADVFVEAELAKSLPRSAFKSRTAMRLVESLKGVEITDARQTVTIGTADLELSLLMDIELNAPVAHVRRTVVDQHGVIVLIADGIYRGDVVKFKFKLR